MKSISSERDLMAPLQQLAEAINNGDSTLARAAYASPASIIDGFPPYAWQGPTAGGDWWNAWEAFSKDHGITNVRATLGSPQQVEVTGDRAYMVVSAAIESAREGRVAESRGTMTVALTKVGEHWLIGSWAWTH